MQQVVYVANPVSGLIHVFRLEAGTLAPLQEVQTGGEVQPPGHQPGPALAPCGVRPDFRVLSFPIAADGRLGPRPRRRCSAAPPTPAPMGAAASSLPPPTPSTTSPSPARIRRAGCSPSPASRPPDGGPLGHLAYGAKRGAGSAGGLPERGQGAPLCPGGREAGSPSLGDIHTAPAPGPAIWHCTRTTAISIASTNSTPPSVATTGRRTDR